jgi:hypothetical protein
MLTYENLEEWLEDLRKIIFDTNVSFCNIKRLTHTKDPIEKEVINHGFFSHFYYQSRFTLIVQLCKLYGTSSNQKRSFEKLFKRLTDDPFDNKIDCLLNDHANNKRLFSNRDDIKKEIEILKDDLSTNRILIKGVVTLRDKYYAHFDPDSDLPIVKIDDLQKLVDLAIKIFNNIRGGLFDVTFFFDLNEEWLIDYPLMSLVKLRKEKLEKFDQLKRNIK